MIQMECPGHTASEQFECNLTNDSKVWLVLGLDDDSVEEPGLKLSS